MGEPSERAQRGAPAPPQLTGLPPALEWLFPWFLPLVAAVVIGVAGIVVALHVGGKTSRSVPPPPSKSVAHPASTTRDTSSVVKVYLDSLVVDSGAAPVDRGVVSVDGLSLAHSVAFRVAWAGGGATASYALGATYTHFSATLALRQPTMSGIVVHFRVQAGGETVIDRAVDGVRTQTISVSFPPTGQLTLISDFGTQFGGCDAVWGAAVVSG